MRGNHSTCSSCVRLDLLVSSQLIRMVTLAPSFLLQWRVFILQIRLMRWILCNWSSQWESWLGKEQYLALHKFTVGVTYLVVGDSNMDRQTYSSAANIQTLAQEIEDVTGEKVRTIDIETRVNPTPVTLVKILYC